MFSGNREGSKAQIAAFWFGWFGLVSFGSVSFRLFGSHLGAFGWPARPFQLSNASGEEGSGVGREESWAPTGRQFQREDRQYGLAPLLSGALLSREQLDLSARKLALLLLARPLLPVSISQKSPSPKGHFRVDGLLLSPPQGGLLSSVPVSAPSDINCKSARVFSPILNSNAVTFSAASFTYYFDQVARVLERFCFLLPKIPTPPRSQNR